MPRQWVLMKFSEPAKRPGGSRPQSPLGSLQQVKEALAKFNTAADGGESSRIGTELLHGPGFVVEVPNAQTEVSQAMITAQEDDIAWPVVSRICRTYGWSVTDLDSGQVWP